MLIAVSHRSVLGRASSAWAGAFLVGGIAGPVISAVLVRWGLRVPFLAYGGVLIVVALGTAVHLRGRSGTTGESERKSLAIGFGGASRSWSFRAALAGHFVEGWTDGGVRLLLVPLVVTGTCGRTADWSGFALAAFAAGTAVGLPVGGWLVDHRGRRLPALLGSATLAVTAVGLAASSTVIELLFASVVSGLGTGLTSPPVNAAVGD